MKSVSRFARNTLDCIKYIRLLKELNVDVYFEEQNLHSTDVGAEFYITIYGCIAQTESENISSNVAWDKARSAKARGCAKARSAKVRGCAEGGSAKARGHNGSGVVSCSCMIYR